MKLKILAATAAIAICSIGSAATAASLALTGGAPVLEVAPGVPVGQDFVPEILAAGASHLYSGPLQLTAAGKVRVTFTLVAAESGFSNSLLLDGSEIITESRNGPISVDFETGVLDGETFSTIVGPGDLAARLSFDTNEAAVPIFGSGDDEFGVFADSTKIDNLKIFWLALDDSGANEDDNHDDIIVRVEISAVPLPAGGLLLLGGLGGLVALRRRKKS